VFALLDKDHKQWVGVFDIEKLLIQHKRSSSQRSLVEDIELLVQMYDRQGQSKRIMKEDFIAKLGP
jgi:hypothetical protein